MSFERRCVLSKKVLSLYPDRIPVMVVPSPDAPPPTKTKYLAPADMELHRFVTEIRKNIAIESSEALFVFVGNPDKTNSMIIPSLTTHMGLIYEQHKHTDGMLYVRYALENTFG